MSFDTQNKYTSKKSKVYLSMEKVVVNALLKIT